jgi:hypothetical protein
MQIEWSQEEVLKLAVVRTEAEEGAREGEVAGIDDRRWCERVSEVGIESGTGRTGRSAVNRAEVRQAGLRLSRDARFRQHIEVC